MLAIAIANDRINKTRSDHPLGAIYGRAWQILTQNFKY